MGFKSIITDDTDHCYICDSPYVECHHAIYGCGKRDLSTAYMLLVPLCHAHHMELHNSNPQMAKFFKAKAQECFEKHYPDKDFLKIFGKNYKENENE